MRRDGAATVLVRFCRKKPLGAVGGAIMLVMLLVAVFAAQLATHDPIATSAAATLAPPSAEHWLGTDHLGRDTYSRLIWGTRVSLIVGVASTLLGSFFGGVIGLLSGYFGGKLDLIIQRLLDILQGLPLLVLALVMAASLGPSIPNVVVAISIPIMPRAARVIRASVLSIREMQYVEAARALGLQHLRIAFRHVMPNTIGPFIVLMTAQLGSAILTEAALSFLGSGRPGAVSVVGAHALGVGRRIRAEGALPRALPGHRHQPRRLRVQSPRRRASRYPRPAPARRLKRRRGRLTSGGATPLPRRPPPGSRRARGAAHRSFFSDCRGHAAARARRASPGKPCSKRSEPASPFIRSCLAPFGRGMAAAGNVG